MTRLADRKPYQTPTILLPMSVRDEIAADTYDRLPREACGALFGARNPELIVVENYRPLTNAAENPDHAFLLKPEEWVKCCFTPNFIGIYHSHPTTLPEPSATDLEDLPRFGSLFPLYMIGSPVSFGDGKAAAQAKKPPDDPDDFLLNAYFIEETERLKYDLSKIMITFC
ncbi:Mov34/MPN/PAD-1 family protein [Paenibacillus sp. alder61]|uniref:Mov34/MPN/PAD-1 family protein n=1 Tax=Paenibacillus sp. alder61 TaxID=2862948 RepID=UPI001CD41BFD|nr:Mov34/MPN/PAD-1 family protein [Paenibacillus sp. alder61]MCA1291583.1 Mov34/MPN/PAD-1 family protein [Paenibacillus sp. alder61]